MFAEQIRRLLRSDDPESRWLGLGLASRVDPAPFLAELRRLAPAADRRTRRAIAGLLARAPSAPLAPLLDELLDADELSGELIALQVKLIRGEQLSQVQAERLAGSRSRSVAALVALIVGPPERWRRSRRGVARPGPPRTCSTPAPGPGGPICPTS